MKNYYVYILSSRRNGTLYVGVTSDLSVRIAQHREGTFDGFTKRYCVSRLVHFEVTDDVWAALERERRLKKWNRAWKIELIESGNPDWRDLYQEISAG